MIERIEHSDTKKQDDLTGKTILVIEDDRFITRVYTRWLTAAGVRVLTASDGNVGLDILDQEVIDVVLLDLGMPGLNGYDTLTRIRKDLGLVDIPVIVMSNTTLDENSEEFKHIQEAGVTRILRKYETSLNTIQTVIRESLKERTTK